VIALYHLYVETRPYRDRSLVHLIKCACEPDPAMQRMGFPRPVPFDAAPELPPQYAPSR
jgi:hypothetical protein